jgi:hypothetical protein
MKGPLPGERRSAAGWVFYYLKAGSNQSRYCFAAVVEADSHSTDTIIRFTVYFQNGTLRTPYIADAITHLERRGCLPQFLRSLLDSPYSPLMAEPVSDARQQARARGRLMHCFFPYGLAAWPINFAIIALNLSAKPFRDLNRLLDYVTFGVFREDVAIHPTKHGLVLMISGKETFDLACCWLPNQALNPHRFQ